MNSQNESGSDTLTADTNLKVKLQKKVKVDSKDQTYSEAKFYSKISIK